MTRDSFGLWSRYTLRSRYADTAKKMWKITVVDVQI